MSVLSFLEMSFSDVAFVTFFAYYGAKAVESK